MPRLLLTLFCAALCWTVRAPVGARDSSALPPPASVSPSAPDGQQEPDRPSSVLL